MAKKLLIIQPSHYRSRSDPTVIRSRKRKVVPLTLPYLAALTPADWEVKLMDEQLDGVDFNAACDLAAITVWTINSLRAYDIADRFRDRGIPVIMGGPHIFFHTAEAAGHCDSMGIGEGEGIWREMLADAESGRLKKIYRSGFLQDLAGLPLPRYDLLDMKRFGIFKTFSVQSSRGCPFKCEFCSERFYLGEHYRFRPVPEVIGEIRSSGAGNVLFADSNFGGNTGHAMDLMEAMVPLKIRWSALWPARLCGNREFLDLARRSGVLHVNIGLESVNPETLGEMNKKMNVMDWDGIFREMGKRGISYSLNFIFGSDSDTEGVFAATRSFLMRNRVPAAYFYILTPHKGSQLYERLESEGRIIDIDGLGRWPGATCRIRPLHFTPEGLVQNIKGLHRDFYSLKSMLARLPPPFSKSALASWMINMAERKSFRTGAENFSDL